MKFYLLLLSIIFCNIINAKTIDVIHLRTLIDRADNISYTGPKLHCKPKEIEGDATGHGYKFEIENLKSDPKTHYSIEFIDYLGKNNLSIQLESVGNDQFHMHCQGQTTLLKDFILQLGGMCPGEPIYFALRSEKKEVICATRMIPFPCEAKTVNGKKVSLELISRGGESYACIGEGFAPNEKLQFVSISEGECMTSAIQATEEGLFHAMVYPFVKGKISGSGGVVIVASDGAVIKVPFEWGFLKLREVAMKNHVKLN